MVDQLLLSLFSAMPLDVILAVGNVLSDVGLHRTLLSLALTTSGLYRPLLPSLVRQIYFDPWKMYERLWRENDYRPISSHSLIQ